MLILAHMGVMKNDKEYVFIYHYPLILGHFFVFSSTKTQKSRDVTTNKAHTNDERKEFFLLFNICGC